MDGLCMDGLWMDYMGGAGEKGKVDRSVDATNARSIGVG